jgi:AraC family transcriptional activator of pobA
VQQAIRPVPKSAVPLFFLYGEPRRSVGPRFLHLESLEERSRPTDWHIRPHAHADLHQIFLITTGAGRMDADGQVVRFGAPCLLTVPARTVHGFTWQTDTCGHVLTLADAYWRDLLAREPDFSSLFTAPGCLTGLAPGEMEARLTLLARELAWSAPAHAAAVDSLLLMVLVETVRLQRLAAGQARPLPGKAAELVARFRELVETKYRAGVAVEKYARLLGVTPAMLRRACMSVAGCPPVQLVQDRVFLEAQRILLYTNMNVSEAATYLGFRDHAYFSRFFTKHAGESPRAFRTRPPLVGQSSAGLGRKNTLATTTA